jgi:glyoxylase-like metal-dependent hydrolase (beta-lactamase superfamily II)
MPETQLTEGVYQLPLTFELEERDMVLHPAAVETNRGLLMIDVGFPPGLDQHEETLDQIGFEFDDIWGVLLTHQDPDHVSGLAALTERTDPVVFAHPECAPYVDGREFPVKMDDERYDSVPVNVEVTERTRFSTAAGPMEVVYTPGHAPGHISLYFHDEHLLISGDALHAPEGEIDGPRYPLDEEMAVDSIETLAAFDIEQTLTYHDGLVEHDSDAIGSIETETDE